MGCVREVVFGGKNCKLMAFSPETSGCAGQLSTTRTITIELAQPFLKQCSVHPCFLLRSIPARAVTNVFEASWFCRFPITNIGSFSPRALDAAIPVNRTLLCFPPAQRLPRKCKDFECNAL